MKKTHTKALRFFAALCLLAAVIWFSNPAKLAKSLSSVDLRWFALAVAVAILANAASALRWTHIARILGMTAPALSLFSAYGRGVTANNLLPGATLSGDMLRSYQLHKLGNPLGLSMLSVILDRFSGLWALCLISALAATALWSGWLDVSALVQDERLATPLIIYACFMGCLILLPFLHLPQLKAYENGRFSRQIEAWQKITEKLVIFRRNLSHMAVQSLVVQLFSALAFWLGGVSIGLTASYWLVLALCAPIFIMAALPITIGGWGTREFAAVLVLGLAGIPSETAAAMGILYGLCGAIQGILYSPLFLVSKD